MAGRIDDYKNQFISGNLKKDIKAFQSIFENDVTFRIKRVCARKNVFFDAALLYIDGMIDSIQVSEAIIEPLLEMDTPNDSKNLAEYVEKQLIFALLPLISVVLRAFFLVLTKNPPTSAPQRQKWRILYRSRVQSFKESICATSINIIMCINLIICSLAFFQEIVPNSALRLYFAYIPHEMHEDLLSRQQ